MNQVNYKLTLFRSTHYPAIPNLNEKSALHSPRLHPEFNKTQGLSHRLYSSSCKRNNNISKDPASSCASGKKNQLKPEQKTFKSALKSRPTTCSPLKKVKFSMVNPLFKKNLNWKCLFANMKSSFKKQHILVHSPDKKTGNVVIDTINSL